MFRWLLMRVFGLEPDDNKEAVMMCCQRHGIIHEDYDFDGTGMSTTGCDCTRLDLAEELNSTPTEEGPGGEESYDKPEGSDD